MPLDLERPRGEVELQLTSSSMRFGAQPQWQIVLSGSWRNSMRGGLDGSR